MDPNEYAALARAWWACNKETVRKAVNAAVLARTLRKVKEALGERAKDGSSWFGALGLINAPVCQGLTHLWRLFKGERLLQNEFLLGIATVLKLNVREFYPCSTEEWVAGGTRYLCPDVTEEEAAAYARFMLENPPGQEVRTAQAIGWALERLPAATRSQVQKVARAIGSRLSAI